MTSALSGLLILLYVLPGFVAAFALDRQSRRGRLVRTRAIAHALQERVLTASLWVLLVLMGLRLMVDPQVASNLPVLGATALLFAAVAVTFSVLAALPLAIRSIPEASKTSDAPETLGEGERGETRESDLGLKPADRGHPVRKVLSLLVTPLVLLALVAAGAVLALAVPGARQLPVNLLTEWCLKVMLVAVGFGLGFTPIGTMGGAFSPQALALPFITMAASLAAGLACAALLGRVWGQSLAVSAGFGWYSLSGILIADMGNASLGATAFLANLFRESLSLLLIPLLQHRRLTGSAIAAAGATSMDVSLPVLSLFGAKSHVPLAVYHGFVLSLAVPILVPLFMGV